MQVEVRMKNLVRFEVSVERKLLNAFDYLIAEHQYENRSQAIASLMRNKLIEKDWQLKEECCCKG